MKRCLKCQKELAADALFCDGCGERCSVPDLSRASEAEQVERAQRAIAEMERVGAGLPAERLRELAAIAQDTPQMREQLTALTAGLEAQTTRAATLEQEVLALRRLPTAAVTPDVEQTHGFRDLGEFLQATMLRRIDPRLRSIFPAVAVPEGQRDLATLPGAAGGFLIPPQFAAMLEAITPQEAIVRPRATVIPAGDMPDASITMPVMNQSGANGVFAGMTGAWIGEQQVKPETQPILAQLTLNPHEVAALVDVSDRLLRNNGAAVSALVQTGFRDVILAMEDVAFISGNGIGRPLGFLGHASDVNVVRAGGGAVVYADVVNMFWRMLRLGTGRPVWLVHPSVLPQLQLMASPLGQLIWQPSAREGQPNSLMGYPVVINERQPVLGAVGDLMFVNLRYYLIKEGTPLSIKDDMGINDFRHNTTCIKAFRSVDGQPWLATALLLEDGVTTTSPFVILN